MVADGSFGAQNTPVELAESPNAAAHICHWQSVRGLEKCGPE